MDNSNSNSNNEDKLNNQKIESSAENSTYINNKTKYKWTTGCISDNSFFNKKNINKSLAS